jgi:hypothetical protein
VANQNPSIDLTQVTSQKIDGLTLSMDVGTRWRLKPVASDKAYECTYVGSVYPTFLLATLPAAASGAREVFPPERAVMVSFLHDDYNICKFETQVKARSPPPSTWSATPIPSSSTRSTCASTSAPTAPCPAPASTTSRPCRAALNISNGGAKAAFLGDNAAALRDIPESTQISLRVTIVHGGPDLVLPAWSRRSSRTTPGGPGPHVHRHASGPGAGAAPLCGDLPLRGQVSLRLSPSPPRPNLFNLPVPLKKL